MSSDNVEGAVKEFKGDFMLSFNRLAVSHDPTNDWSNMTFVRRRGVMDIGDEAPEFLYDDSATRSFKNQWWRTCVSVRQHRISAYPHIDAIWTKLSQVAVTPHPITPRFMKYIEDLGKKHLDQPSFWKAIRTLWAQQEYDGIVAVIGEPKHQFISDKDKHPAIPILQVLLTDGLISPAAAGWLALAIYLDNVLYKNYIPLFFGFSAIRRKVWNDRNVHLAACADTEKDVNMGGGNTASHISAKEARDTYASVTPGTLKHAFEKQRARTEVKAPGRKDNSSRGSKRSRRLRGKPPGDESLVEEVEETTSEALAGLLQEER